MASRISILTNILVGSHIMDPLYGYHAARECVNANRMVGAERRFMAIRAATKNYRVMVSLTDAGIRIYRPDTNQEYIMVL